MNWVLVFSVMPIDRVKMKRGKCTFRLTASRMPPGRRKTVSFAANNLYKLLPDTGTAPIRRDKSGIEDGAMTSPG
jgi:hypothetical protein